MFTLSRQNILVSDRRGQTVRHQAGILLGVHSPLGSERSVAICFFGWDPY